MNLRVCIWIFISITIGMLSQSYSNAAKQWKSKCPVLNIPNAKIRIRARGRMAKIRCESDYTMIEGDRRLTCIKGKWNGRIPQCISNGCSIDNVPNGGAIELYDGALLHFHCNPGYALTGSPALFCDGSNWNATYPQCEVPLPNPDHLSCTFETNDLCGWVQDHVDDLDWKWTTGTNNAFSGSLGAKADHTLGNPTGHYIFADSKDDWYHGSVARLFSPILPNPVQTPACVIFWYHMNGFTTGSLNVYIKPESDPFEILVPAMTVTGYNQDAWKIGYVGLPDIEEEFLQIIFEAKGGNEHNSDVAIDDFLVTSGDECIASEVKLIEQQSNDSSQNISIYNNNKPIPTKPVKTTKSKGKSTTALTIESEEVDYSYIPFSTSSLKIPHDSTTFRTYFSSTSAEPLESTIKASTPRKVYISTPKSTLPIIFVVSTPPTTINLTPFLPRRTLTPLPIITSIATTIKAITDTTTKEQSTSRKHSTTTAEEYLSTIEIISQNPSNNSVYSNSTKLLTKSTTSMPFTSLIYPSQKPSEVVTRQPSLTQASVILLNLTTTPTFSSKKLLPESTSSFPITLPPKYTLLSSKIMPPVIITKMSSKYVENIPLITVPSTSTKLKLSTKSSNIQILTKNPKISSKPSNYTSNSISDSPSSASNKLHTRPLPGVVILISIVAVGLLATAVLLGTIWVKRLRYRPFLAEDSDVRQLKEEMTEEDHATGENVETGNKRTFPTSYRPLENSSFPQAYDGTPV